MPTTPSDAGCAVSRRAAIGLAVAGVAVVSGCTPSGVDRRAKPTPTQTQTPDEDPDVALAATVLTGEQAMLDRVLATVRHHPGLGPVLSGAETAHRAHVRLLTDAVPDDARPSPTPSVGASGTGAPSATPAATPTTAPRTPVPAHPGPALALLAGEEDHLSLVDKRSAFAAESGAFARVLASMAAAAAQQAVALNLAAAEQAR